MFRLLAAGWVRSDSKIREPHPQPQYLWQRSEHLDNFPMLLPDLGIKYSNTTANPHQPWKANWFYNMVSPPYCTSDSSQPTGYLENKLFVISWPLLWLGLVDVSKSACLWKQTSSQRWNYKGESSAPGLPERATRSHESQAWALC